MNRWQRLCNFLESKNSKNDSQTLEFELDRLEARMMLAGDVVCKVSGDNLTITGTSEADEISVEVVEGEITVNGEGTGLSSSDLNNLTIKSKQGDDVIALGGDVGSEYLTVGGNLKVITSSGDDTVYAYDLEVSGKTTIKTAAGEDLVNTYNAFYGNTTKIITGGDDDQVCLAMVSDGTPGLRGGGGVEYDVVFEGKATVSTGGGNDNVFIGSFGGIEAAADALGGSVIVSSSLKLNGGGGSEDFLNVDGMFFDPEVSMPPSNVSVKGFEPFIVLV